MDWWQAGSVMGTVVLATTAVATFGWRVLRQETDKLRHELRRETDKLRQQSDTLRRESREAHDRIGERITQVQVGLSAEIAQGRTEIGQLRDGQASLREGIGEIRGELKGVRHSLEILRGDFRAHVFGRQD